MKIIKYLIILIFLIGCSNEFNEPRFIEPIKAVETFINNPKGYYPIKTNTNYYEIVRKDSNFIYWGYQTLDWKLDRILKPFYKTPREEYYDVVQKSSKISRGIADQLIADWFLNKYPSLKNDSIEIAQITKVQLIRNNKSEKFDSKCNGWIEFYVQKMERSNEFGIDSVMVNHIIRKYNYECVIENANKIFSIKSQ